MKNPDATTEYLKAILYNRMGNKNDMKEALNKAVQDAFYAKYAANDLELKR